MPKPPVATLKELPDILKSITGEFDLKLKKVTLKTKDGWETYEGEGLANLVNNS